MILCKNRKTSFPLLESPSKAADNHDKSFTGHDMTTQLVPQPQNEPKPDISAIAQVEKAQRSKKPLILFLGGLAIVAGISTSTWYYLHRAVTTELQLINQKGR
jgi:hypothetical protein